MVSDMAIMNPSKLRDVLDLLPYCNLSDSKKRAIEAIITKYLNGEIVPVVRCKDCCHKHIVTCEGMIGCIYKGKLIQMKPTDYCSYGERI